MIINSKRPSLWYKNHGGLEVLRIYHPGGNVEQLMLSCDHLNCAVWIFSYFTDESNPKAAIRRLKAKHEFLGYL